MTIEYETIAKALFINYESLYDINMETDSYLCFFQSESYEMFKLEKNGTNFFKELEKTIPKAVFLEDQEYVLNMLSKEALLEGTGRGEIYSFVYRVYRDGKAVYHKIRAKRESVEGIQHVYLGIRDIDYLINQERKHAELVNSLLQKEHNHMKAILAGAEGYLEINLSQDKILEREISEDAECERPLTQIPKLPEMNRLSELNQWMERNLLASNQDSFRLLTATSYLIEAFMSGEHRTSLEYSIKRKNGAPQPCRQIFYLYQDDNSNDIMSFCVIYDLTEQQKKEREMKELEQKLQLSRIKNFTSQMQPHFLYNALGSIQEIILEDATYAAKLLGDFTVYLRGCIRSMADDETISFAQELDNIRAYVSIEKMRFGEKLKVEYDLQITDFQVLPLSIQPLVENAIRHGIYQRGNQGGTVWIRTREQDSNKVILVEDNGVGFDYEEYQDKVKQYGSESTGLKNLIFRLESVLCATVDIVSAEGKGTSVTVTIPGRKGDTQSENYNC